MSTGDTCALRLLLELRARGLSVSARGGVLVVSPGSALSADERERVRAAKEQLLDLLWDEDTGTATRALAWPQDSPCWDERLGRLRRPGEREGS